ncbi:MAG: hypothetical protein ABJF11_01735 [Reichenbachiella sp.]|uniref:hypothetical protein n=1 Tax=Reichenbachiella sp. TaxID=2184521 RepID=UPI00326592B9
MKRPSNLLSSVLVCIVLCASSCAGTKYGRHFNYANKGSIIQHSTPVDTSKPEPTASIDPYTGLDQEVKSITESQKPSAPLSESRINPQETTNHHYPTGEHFAKVGKIKNNKPAKEGRKMEPIGLASFGLFLLTVLLLLGEGAVGLSTGLAAILVLVSVIGAGLSYDRIAKNKKRWKGRFFAGFTIIAGMLFLLMLGVASLFNSIFGGT